MKEVTGSSGRGEFCAGSLQDGFTASLKSPSVCVVVPGQVGAPCLRSSDCLDGFCCARHFWTRICKPVLREGQVCTRHRRKGNHGLELFQRCSCGARLVCRTLRDPGTRLPSSSSSLSSSLIAAAVKSDRSVSSSHHYPLLSSASSSSKVAKTRLHVCQRSK